MVVNPVYSTLHSMGYIFWCDKLARSRSGTNLVLICPVSAIADSPSPPESLSCLPRSSLDFFPDQLKPCHQHCDSRNSEFDPFPCDPYHNHPTSLHHTMPCQAQPSSRALLTVADPARLLETLYTGGLALFWYIMTNYNWTRFLYYLWLFLHQAQSPAYD